VVSSTDAFGNNDRMPHKWRRLANNDKSLLERWAG
jgi:hypothetical protein